MILTFLTRLFKRVDGRSSIFSSALDEGIRDTYKQMGYGLDKMGKGNDENKTRDCNSKINGQETFKKANSMKQNLFISLVLLISALPFLLS